MSKTNKKNSKKRIVLIIAIIITITVLIVLIVQMLKLKKAQKDKPDPVNTISWIGYKNAFSDVYMGKKNTLELNTKIQQVFEVYLPILSSEYKDILTEEGLNEYYYENEDYIKDHLLIWNSSDFIKLVQFYRNNKIDEKQMGTIEYINMSYMNNNEYEKIEFTMSFTANKKLAFEARIYDELNNGYEIELLIK